MTFYFIPLCNLEGTRPWASLEQAVVEMTEYEEICFVSECKTEQICQLKLV